jgi:DNA-directed RNA polymerase sigma subunit (sigma70/sigma32)
LCAEASRGVGGPGLDEATRFAQAQGGCAHSLNQLMRQHDGLVQAVVRRQVLGALAFEEALQAGRIGWGHAILGYAPSRGRAFSTYAWPAIMREVWRTVKVPQGRQELTSVGGSPEGGLAEPVAGLSDEAVYRALSHLVAKRPERLRSGIVARYGLADAGPALYREIGAARGVSGEWARRLHQAALARLRQPAAAQTLRSLLERHTQADYENADALAQRGLRQRGGQRTCGAPRLRARCRDAR